MRRLSTPSRVTGSLIKSRTLQSSRRSAFSTEVTYRPLKSHQREVAHVTFKGSKKFAFVNDESVENLSRLFDELETKENLAAVFLRSTFPGADLKVMAELKGRRKADHFIGSVKHLGNKILAFPHPVIAVVDGPCLGAGLEVVASCDLRIAVDGLAKFGMPETLLGIPSVAQASLLPGLIGWGRTRFFLYFGQTINAREAYDWGLVNHVAAADRIAGLIDDYENKIDATGLGALTSQKSVIRRWQEYDAGIRGNTDEINGEFSNRIGQGEPGRLMQGFLNARRK